VGVGECVGVCVCVCVCQLLVEGGGHFLAGNISVKKPACVQAL
jgi:hypothetical protein